MFAYILLCLGLLHRSFLLIFGQEMPKGMCLVLVKSNVGIKRKFFFSKIATKKDFFLHSNEKNKINLLNTEIFFCCYTNFWFTIPTNTKICKIKHNNSPSTNREILHTLFCSPYDFPWYVPPGLFVWQILHDSLATDFWKKDGYYIFVSFFKNIFYLFFLECSGIFRENSFRNCVISRKKVQGIKISMQK